MVKEQKTKTQSYRVLGFITIFAFFASGVVSSGFIREAAPSQHRARSQVAGCAIFPDDNIWNAPVESLPVDANSDAYIATIGANGTLHPDFGSGDGGEPQPQPPGSGSPIGIPYVDVPGTQVTVPITLSYADESDPAPYPIPTAAPISSPRAPLP